MQFKNDADLGKMIEQILLSGFATTAAEKPSNVIPFPVPEVATEPEPTVSLMDHGMVEVELPDGVKMRMTLETAMKMGQ